VPFRVIEASAEALRFQDYLIDDTERAVLLHSAGVPVTVPSPARFGVHKLIVAGLRRGEDALRRQKDIAQAKALRDALAYARPGAWEDAVEDARRRGRKWRDALDPRIAEIRG
jgi:hypothetical protein